MKMEDEDTNNKLLTILCRLQIGVQVEEDLQALCAETVPLKLFDEFDIRRIANRLMNNPNMAKYATELLNRMEELELKRPEIEAEEKKAEEEAKALLAEKKRSIEMAKVKETVTPVVSSEAVAPSSPEEVTVQKAPESPAFAVPMAPVQVNNSSLETAKKKKRRIKHRKQNKTQEGNTDSDQDVVHEPSNGAEAVLTKSEEPVFQPIPHVYESNFLFFEVMYYRSMKEMFEDRMHEKPEGITWMAFFKQVHKEKIEADRVKDEGDDIIYMSGPAPGNDETHRRALPQVAGPSNGSPKNVIITGSLASTPTAKPNDETEDDPNYRVPKVRIDPTYWANRHKYK